MPAESRAKGNLLPRCQLDGPGRGERLGACAWGRSWLCVSGTQLLAAVLSWASLAFCNQGCLRAKPDRKWLVHQRVCTSSWLFRRWSEPCEIPSLPLWQKKVCILSTLRPPRAPCRGWNREVLLPRCQHPCLWESLPESLPPQHSANCWDRLCLLSPENVVRRGCGGGSRACGREKGQRLW